MKNVYLVIGGNGLVGRRFLRDLRAKEGTIIGTYYSRREPGLKKLNILNLEELERCFGEIKPTHVFFCANFSGGVFACEKNPSLSDAFHEKAVQDIGRLCHNFKCYFIFLSTDYVFNGKKSEYIETDIYSHLNIYGRAKMNAEKWLLKHLSDILVIRTTNIYGWDPSSVTPNYIMQCFCALRKQETFTAIDNLFGKPTYVGSLTKAVLELIEVKARGIYHIVGADYVSRYEWIREACRVFKFDCRDVNKEFLDFDHMEIQSPKGVNLSTQKFRNMFQMPLLGIRKGLENMRDDMCSHG